METLVKALGHLGEKERFEAEGMCVVQNCRESSQRDDEPFLVEERDFQSVGEPHVHFDVFQWGGGRRGVDGPEPRTESFCAIPDRTTLNYLFYLVESDVSGWVKPEPFKGQVVVSDGAVDDPVLVCVRDSSQDHERMRRTTRLPKFEGLVLLYKLESVRREPMRGGLPSRRVPLKDVVPPLPIRFRDRKLCMCPGGTTVRQNECVDEVVQGRANIMSEVSQQNPQADARIGDAFPEEFLSPPLRKIGFSDPQRIAELDFEEVPAGGVYGIEMHLCTGELHGNTFESHRHVSILLDVSKHDELAQQTRQSPAVRSALWQPASRRLQSPARRPASTATRPRYLCRHSSPLAARCRPGVVPPDGSKTAGAPI
jgi:hypothetical protein